MIFTGFDGASLFRTRTQYQGRSHDSWHLAVVPRSAQIDANKAACAGRGPVQRTRLRCEQLEDRTLPSATIRVAAYNIEADVNGVATPLPGLYQVLEGIGEEQVQGDVQPLDILSLEETTSNSETIAPIVSNLNSFYAGLAVYAQSPYQATQYGSNTIGNGPNGLVYNTLTLNLLASVGVGTPEGATNGEYRQVVRYEFQPVGDMGSTGIFYVYVSHMKSGSTSADATDRGEEATIIRNDEASLPANASVLYMGDLNTAPPEAMFTNFTAAGQGEAYDPVNFSTSVQYFSESDTDLRYRDDYQLMTANVLNDTAGSLGYVSGSLHNFGNNGTTPANGSVNSGSDTALNSDLVQDGPPNSFISASALYGDLTTASDHLPVVADYAVPIGGPSIGSFAIGPSTVTVGGSSTLTASNVTDVGGTITGVSFYRESNGTSGLQIGSDTLVGSGVQNGTTWTLASDSPGLAAGTYTYYAVATDSNSLGSSPSSATLTINTSSPIIGSFRIEPECGDGRRFERVDGRQRDGRRRHDHRCQFLPREQRHERLADWVGYAGGQRRAERHNLDAGFGLTQPGSGDVYVLLGGDGQQQHQQQPILRHADGCLRGD